MKRNLSNRALNHITQCNQAGWSLAKAVKETEDAGKDLSAVESKLGSLVAFVLANSIKKPLDERADVYMRLRQVIRVEHREVFNELAALQNMALDVEEKLIALDKAVLKLAEKLNGEEKCSFCGRAKEGHDELHPFDFNPEATKGKKV
jgi:hypothetical protein